VRGRKRIGRFTRRPWKAQTKVRIRERRKERVVKESRNSHGGVRRARSGGDYRESRDGEGDVR
jgi:hypothetical protein